MKSSFLSSRTAKTIVLASGRFLTSLMSLISVSLLCRLLSVQDYATYRQTMLVYTFALPLLTMGFPEALFYFLPGEQKRAREILITNLFVLEIAAGGLTLFLLLGGNVLIAKRFNNPALEGTLRAFALYPIFMIPLTSITACLMARDRVQTLAKFELFTRILGGFGLVGVCLIWPTPLAAIWANVISAVAIGIWGVRLMFDACPGATTRPQLAGIWEQMQYGFPVGLASGITALSLSLDKTIVSSLCSTKEFAIYVTGALELPFIGILTGSVTAVLTPDYARLFREQNFQEILALWHRAMIRCLVMLLPIMGFVLVMAPELMRILFSAKYTESAYPFRIYALLLPIRATNFGAVLMGIKQTKVIMRGALLNLTFNAVLSFIFVKWFGAAGAAWATIVAILLLAIFNAATIVKTLKAPYMRLFPWKEMARISIGVLPAALVIFWLSSSVSSFPDIIRLLTAALIFGVLLVPGYHVLHVMSVGQIWAFTKQMWQKGLQRLSKNKT